MFTRFQLVVSIVLAMSLYADALAQSQRGKGDRGVVSAPAADGADIVPIEAIGQAVVLGITRPSSVGSAPARARGMIETGLVAQFDPGVYCRDVDEEWAMDYSAARGRDALHGGMDIAAPRGTPILAVADGEVIAKFLSDENAQGIQIWLRHAPADTGLAMWTYTQYTHLDELPDLAVGVRVKMGEPIGKTGNSGISGAEARERSGAAPVRRGSGGGVQPRRDAVHFAAIVSDSRKYFLNERFIVPQDGWWTDPHALYRKAPPFDSAAMKALPTEQKTVRVPYMLDDGTRVPADTKLIWPYACSRAPLPPTRKNTRR